MNAHNSVSTVATEEHRLSEGQSILSAFSYSSHSLPRWQRVVVVEKLAYAWVELCYARQSEQFDTPWVEGEYDDEWGMVDKLAVSTQSCIHDQEHQRVVVADCEITMRVDKVGKEEVQLTHGYINVVRVDAQVGMQTIGGFLQPFAIGGF